MTEREAIIDWLERTFPGCVFSFWLGGQIVSFGKHGDVLAGDWMVTIKRPALG